MILSFFSSSGPCYSFRCIPSGGSRDHISIMNDIRKYAVEAIGNIIPLDEASLGEIVDHTLTLKNHEIELHLLDLLGHSDSSYEVIRTILDSRQTASTSSASASVKSPTPPSHLPSPWTESPSPAPSGKLRLSKSRDSTTVSELADSKPLNKLTPQQVKRSKKKNLDSLKDIESALAELEVEDRKEDASGVRRSCNCMATRHPLFEVAPNCLNCGKIICEKEGLQPCLFCGAELLSASEKHEIVEILRSEQNEIERKQQDPTNKKLQAQSVVKKKAKPIKYAMTTGGNLWKAQEAALERIERDSKKQEQAEKLRLEEAEDLQQQLAQFDKLEREQSVNLDLLKAQDRLEMLLEFQATGAERTRVIDNAADFEMPTQLSGSMWLSPVERALQLKKQQRHMRKVIHQEKVSTGRTKKVVEMVIRDGKVKMVEKHVVSHEPEKEKAEIEDLENALRENKMDAEATLASNKWDYESDRNKWAKPVYLGGLEGNKDDVSEPGHTRVQFGDLSSDELLAAIPS